MHKMSFCTLYITQSAPPQQLCLLPPPTQGPSQVSCLGLLVLLPGGESEKVTFLRCFLLTFSSLCKTDKMHLFFCLLRLPPTPFVFGAERDTQLFLVLRVVFTHL